MGLDCLFSSCNLDLGWDFSSPPTLQVVEPRQGGCCVICFHNETNLKSREMLGRNSQAEEERGAKPEASFVVEETF